MCGSMKKNTIIMQTRTMKILAPFSTRFQYKMLKCKEFHPVEQDTLIAITSRSLDLGSTKIHLKNNMIW